MLAVAGVVETPGRLAVVVGAEQQGHLGLPHKQELLELQILAAVVVAVAIPQLFKMVAQAVLA